MKREPVNSSLVRSMGYDADSTTLEIEFQSGAVVHYLNVPETVYRGLQAAPSKGAYMQQHLKGRYWSRQVQ